MPGPSLSNLLNYSQICCRALPGNIFASKYLNTRVGFRQIYTRNSHCNAFNCVSKPFKTPKLRSTIATNPVSKVFARGFSDRPPGVFAGQKTAERLRLKDGVPKSYTLIYRSDFPNYLLFSQLMVFLTTGAIITGFGMYLIQDKTEEEKQALIAKQKEKIDDFVRRDKESKITKLLMEVKGDQKSVNDTPAKPSLEDFVEADTAQVFVIVASFIVLAIGLVRIQRLLPVRIYASNKSEHCIAVMYGHVIPGRITWHEFLAGTVESAGEKRFEFYWRSLYKDGSGKSIILMDQYFRSPEDYNRVMGYSARPYCNQDVED